MELVLPLASCIPLHLLIYTQMHASEYSISGRCACMYGFCRVIYSLISYTSLIITCSVSSIPKNGVGGKYVVIVYYSNTLYSVAKYNINVNYHKNILYDINPS